MKQLEKPLTDRKAPFKKDRSGKALKVSLCDPPANNTKEWEWSERAWWELIKDADLL